MELGATGYCYKYYIGNSIAIENLKLMTDTWLVYKYTAPIAKTFITLPRAWCLTFWAIKFDQDEFTKTGFRTLGFSIGTYVC